MQTHDPAQDTPHASTAAHFLDGLVESDIRYLFANLGTDHVALIEAMAQFGREGRPQPQVLLCPHENVAIHMAGGYAALTGQGQAVLVHVDAGTANAAMGVHNLFRTRLPVLLMAGRSPYTLRGELPGSRDNYIHFVQDPFDIGSLVRPYVKWEYTLPSGVVAKEAVQRAHAVMHSDPPGPAYLTLPRETLEERWPADRVASFAPARHGPVRAGGLTPEAAARVADALIRAERPVAVTSYLGRDAAAVAALQALAETTGLRVVEYMPSALAIDRASPCFAGFDPARWVPQADCCLLLDVDVPWLPKFVQPRADATLIHLDVDPLKADFPMWGFATDLRLPVDLATALPQVLQAVRERADAGFEARVAQRLATMADEAAQRRQATARAAAEPGAPGALSAAFVCATVGAALDADDIIVNEAIRNAGVVLSQMPRSRPGTLLGCAGGGLGWSGGMALGAKLARPQARVVQVVGDGGFHFSTPTSVYAVAQQYGLPILTVVLDNGGWQAVKEAVLRVHPAGEAVQRDDFQARLGGAQRRFAQVGEAFGAHGETVDSAEQLRPALQRCLAAVDRGQAAVLHVRIEPF
ncbi:thiamine pyrophosphate-requiring protein [Aquabacterium sp. J223]|uniref:thiamine pyrophosphate-requiring protein n=1 Tax=Aquabacterium sp. J223 TaxID=2898431 RepID=UPI0021ADF730|nr:thiamine pyrophosphate-requiring protein [Aquabacterium sp. J223]UUX95139.1 thiamine pyrophosphate-requiring protein [Aquabacterium sp. J223]